MYPLPFAKKTNYRKFSGLKQHLLTNYCTVSIGHRSDLTKQGSAWCSHSRCLAYILTEDCWKDSASIIVMPPCGCQPKTLHISSSRSKQDETARHISSLTWCHRRWYFGETSETNEFYVFKRNVKILPHWCLGPRLGPCSYHTQGLYSWLLIPLMAMLMPGV